LKTGLQRLRLASIRFSIFDFRLKTGLQRLRLASIRFSIFDFRFSIEDRTSKAAFGDRSIFDFRLKTGLQRLRLAIVITNRRLVYRILDRPRIQLAGDRNISQEIFNPGLAGFVFVCM
jgi:hypothetical protein